MDGQNCVTATGSLGVRQRTGTHSCRTTGSSARCSCAGDTSSNPTIPATPTSSSQRRSSCCPFAFEGTRGARCCCRRGCRTNAATWGTLLFGGVERVERWTVVASLRAQQGLRPPNDKEAVSAAQTMWQRAHSGAAAALASVARRLNGLGEAEVL